MTQTSERVIITDRQTVIECFDRAVDPVAMWCILRARAPSWHPWCYVVPDPDAIHDRECGAYRPGEECDRCPYSESEDE